MLKFSEMKTRTKVLSGVLMCSMLLGAAAPSMANAITKNQVTYDDPWDIPTKEGPSINALVGVTERDEKKFTEEEWSEIMRRVEAGTIQYTEITEDYLALEEFCKKNNVPPYASGASLDLPMPSLSHSEQLKLYQYYIKNNCSGNILVYGEINDITGEYEITTSFYNREGDLIVSHDLGETWEVKDHIYGGHSRIESDLGFDNWK
ncbi:MAG: hypothetical protein R3Y63_13510 [Eubacteriales bacterium]